MSWPTRTKLSGARRGLQARSVVGGVDLPLLYDDAIWQKWLSRVP